MVVSLRRSGASRRDYQIRRTPGVDERCLEGPYKTWVDRAVV